jgi:hypothetical protein
VSDSENGSMFDRKSEHSEIFGEIAGAKMLHSLLRLSLPQKSAWKATGPVFEVLQLGPRTLRGSRSTVCVPNMYSN